MFKWIKIGSTTFKVGTTIILLKCHSGLHQFGRVVKIVGFKKSFIILCEMFQTIAFDEHFQAFRLKKRRDNFQMAFSVDDLTSFTVYSFHTPSFCRHISNEKFVVTKSEVLQLLFS